jgi:site-specific DNA-methyltransferase (adenine-specific)
MRRTDIQVHNTNRHAVHFSSATDNWATPQDVFDDLNQEFQFTLDPAASPLNAKCDNYFTQEDDGLAQSWKGERVFCNPPYGRVIGKWVEKMSEGGAQLCVGLLPARTDTRWFHDYIQGKADIRFF